MKFGASLCDLGDHRLTVRRIVLNRRLFRVWRRSCPCGKVHRLERRFINPKTAGRYANP